MGATLAPIFMDYKTAIAKLQAELPDIAEIIISHVGSLNSESAERRVALKEVQLLLESLKKIAGQDTDLVEFVTTSKKNSESSTTALAELQSKLEAALVLAGAESRKYKLLKAAQLSNADEQALNKLLEQVETEKIVLEESQVKIEGKPLKDYAAQQGEWMVRALFPSPEGGGVPTGGKTEETPPTPTNTYLGQKAADLFKALGGS
jgi:hypothetical protein